MSISSQRAAASATPPVSRKRDNAVRDIPPTVVRLAPELRARLDAVVARRNEALASQGATTTRNAVIVAAVRELCERDEARGSKP